MLLNRFYGIGNGNSLPYTKEYIFFAAIMLQLIIIFDMAIEAYST